jgi:hypothetical protein
MSSSTLTTTNLRNRAAQLNRQAVAARQDEVEQLISARQQQADAGAASGAASGDAASVPQFAYEAPYQGVHPAAIAALAIAGMFVIGAAIGLAEVGQLNDFVNQLSRVAAHLL